MADISNIDGSVDIKDNFETGNTNDVAINNQVVAHVAGVADKHSANVVLFSPILNITATEVQTAIDQVNTRVSTIIASSGTSDTEVVDARASPTFGPFAVLKDRMDNIEGVYALDAKISDSLARDANDYSGNKKLGDDGETTTDWTASGSVVSSDLVNVKVGSQSIKILEADNVGSFLGAILNDLTLDYSILDNGKSSDENDYITIPVYISNIAFFDNLSIVFSQDTPYSTTNIKFSTVFAASLITGWNYLKIKKSNFNTNGGGAWSGIQSMKVEWQSLPNAINQYISIANGTQLVKKHPTLDEPLYTQKNNDVEFDVDGGEPFVGLEFNQNIIRLLEESPQKGITSVKTYKNFTVFSRVRLETNARADAVGWYVNDLNTIRVYNRDNVLRVQYTISGITTNNDTLSLVATKGDITDITIEKNGDFFNIVGENKNGKVEITLELPGLNGLSGSLQHNANGAGFKSTILSTSITEISYSNKSGKSKVAETVEIKYNNGAFVADELNYGEFGIDTANNRLYQKYSSTQVIYYQGTVV